jgi:excisionase family DNA binding protein
MVSVKQRDRAVNRKLTTPEIEASLNHLPPIMTPTEAAALLRLKLSTLYRHVSEGRYGSAVRRGKPLRFWRDRLVQEFMQ